MEIHVGSTNPVKHKIFWRGEPTDADAFPSVAVYDVSDDSVNPNTILYSLIAEKLETEIGVYQVALPVNATYKSRDLKLVWTYTVNGSSQTRSHKLFVVQPYVDLAEAYGVLDFGNDPSDPEYKSYEEIVEAEKYARKIIENYTGQKFYLYNDNYAIYGTDSDTLQLPAKINEVYKFYQNDTLLFDSTNNINNWNYQLDITESGFGLRINRAAMLDNTVYTANGMVPPSINDGSGIFRMGNRYNVFAQYGWADVPDEVGIATVELIQDFFSKDNMWRKKYIGKISTFDWNFEYVSGATTGTGNLYADQLLADYVVSKALLI